MVNQNCPKDVIENDKKTSNVLLYYLILLLTVTVASILLFKMKFCKVKLEKVVEAVTENTAEMENIEGSLVENYSASDVAKNINQLLFGSDFPINSQHLLEFASQIENQYPEKASELLEYVELLNEIDKFEFIEDADFCISTHLKSYIIELERHIDQIEKLPYSIKYRIFPKTLEKDIKKALDIATSVHKKLFNCIFQYEEIYKRRCIYYGNMVYVNRTLCNEARKAYDSFKHLKYKIEF